MTSTENDALHLANQPVGSAGSLSLDTFTFNYLSMDDTATLTASLQYVIRGHSNNTLHSRGLAKVPPNTTWGEVSWQKCRVTIFIGNSTGKG
jgi:hypothetical protein